MSTDNTIEGKKDGGFYKWEVLFLLWVAFWINQADRQLYNTLLGKIQASLNMSDAEAGLVGTMFCWVLAFCLLVAGYAADRFSKKWIIVASITLWSAATMISGAATSCLMFIIFRSVATGVGEGFFAPSNYATISDYHDNRTRATAMSIHTTSYYLGVILSGFVAGWIGDNWGWEHAFYIFGGVGIFWALVIVWRLKDKVEFKNKTELEEARKHKPSWLEAVKIFFTVPTAIVLTLSFVGLIFVVQGYLTWSTLYLQEKFNMSNTSAGFSAAFYMNMAAFFGILIAGYLSDKVAAKERKYRCIISSAGFILASPFIVLMGVSQELVLVFVGFAGFGFFRGFFDANIYSVLYDVIPAKYRGSATGIMQFVGFLLGAPAPWILGMLKPHLGLSLGLAMLSVVWIFFGILMLVDYKLFYAKDCARAQAIDAQS